jgi:acyl-CoA synthetase (AMP-forming)/AMP-acid ligase II
LPLYHNMGLIGNVLQPILVGSRVVFMSPQSFIQKPLRWLKTITKYRGTVSGGPNFAYEFCIRKIKPKEREAISLQSWEVAYCGAEMIHAETLIRFQEFFEPCGFRFDSFFPCYGLAEATLIVTGGTRQVAPKVRTVNSKDIAVGKVYLSFSKEECSTFVSCGWTFPGQKVLVVDPESRERCKPGRVGEIWVKGPSIGQGYFRLPKLTEKHFFARTTDSGEEYFLRTGDLGFLYEGELYITDRLKDLVIIQGQKHYPQLIEWTVQNSHPHLKGNTTVAFSVEVERGNELIILQEVEQTHLPKLNYCEVLDAISNAVTKGHALQPYSTLLIEQGSLPKTSSGKILRQLCCNYFLKGILKQLEY